MKKKRTSFGAVVRWIAMAICILVIICSAVYLIWLALESRQVRLASQSASDQFVREDDSSLSSHVPTGQKEGGETAIPSISVDFEALQAASPYAVAWLQVSGVSAIDYPVVQYTDDSYFLDHSWDGQDSRYGAIFMEAQNASDCSDAYTLIYGHNMKDGSMFGGLKKYAEASFYEENGGMITLCLPGEVRSYQIFSVRYVSPDDAETYTLWNGADDSFDAALQTMKQESVYETGVSVSAEDRVLTLSTCAGDNRLVVHAKLVSTVLSAG